MISAVEEILSDRRTLPPIRLSWRLGEILIGVWFFLMWALVLLGPSPSLGTLRAVVGVVAVVSFLLGFALLLSGFVVFLLTLCWFWRTQPFLREKRERLSVQERSECDDQ